MRLNDIFEGYWKNLQIERDFEKSRRPAPLPKEEFGILISGRMWKKNGEPVSFKSHASALKAADNIMRGRNVATQVIPLKK